jgi:dCMP deaminase
MKDRLSTDKYFLNIAEVVAQRGTCVRRKVGCVLVDSNNHIVATGYNGVAKKFPHCIDQPCEGADYPSGEGLDKCEAIHAELNAFLQLRSDDTSLSMYTTTTPCRECTKVICNSHVKRVVSISQYSQDTLLMFAWAGIKLEVYSNER